jgi:hypothetical protein
MHRCQMCRDFLRDRTPRLSPQDLGTRSGTILLAVDCMTMLPYPIGPLTHPATKRDGFGAEVYVRNTLHSPSPVQAWPGQMPARKHARPADQSLISKPRVFEL